MEVNPNLKRKLTEVHPMDLYEECQKSSRRVKYADMKCIYYHARHNMASKVPGEFNWNGLTGTTALVSLEKELTKRLLDEPKLFSGFL